MHPKYSIDWLLEKYEDEEPLKFLYFWGHTPSAKESVDKSCFSQWFESPFEVDNILYSTAEHWMMAQKALLFKDQEMYLKIIGTEKPGKAKAMGRHISGFDEETWTEHRFQIVVEGNKHKFNQHPALKEFLINTSSRILVEASPVDYIWGIGLAADDPEITDIFSWKGLNLLGFALMEVREGVKDGY